MIAGIVSLLVKAGVAQRWAQPVAWGLVLGLAAFLAVTAWSFLGRHDRAVVAADRSATSVQVLTNTVATDRAAGAAKDARDAAFRNEQSNLQEKADAAADNGASPLDAVLGELR